MTHGLRGPGTITIPRRYSDGVATVPRALSFQLLRLPPPLRSPLSLRLTNNSFLLALHKALYILPVMYIIVQKYSITLVNL